MMDWWAGRGTGEDRRGDTAEGVTCDDRGWDRSHGNEERGGERRERAGGGDRREQVEGTLVKVVTVVGRERT